MKLKDLYENYQLKKSNQYDKISNNKNDKILDFEDCQLLLRYVPLGKVSISYYGDFDDYNENNQTINKYISILKSSKSNDKTHGMVSMLSELIELEDNPEVVHTITYNEKFLKDINIGNYNGYTSWYIPAIKDIEHYIPNISQHIITNMVIFPTSDVEITQSGDEMILISLKENELMKNDTKVISRFSISPNINMIIFKRDK